jgi:hypothetical protein
MTPETKIAIVGIGLVALYIFTQEKDKDKEPDAVIPVEFNALKTRLTAVHNQIQRIEGRDHDEVTDGDCDDWLDELYRIRGQIVDNQIFERLEKKGLTVSFNKERFDGQIAAELSKVQHLKEKISRRTRNMEEDVHEAVDNRQGTIAVAQSIDNRVPDTTVPARPLDIIGERREFTNIGRIETPSTGVDGPTAAWTPLGVASSRMLRVLAPTPPAEKSSTTASSRQKGVR